MLLNEYGVGNGSGGDAQGDVINSIADVIGSDFDDVIGGWLSGGSLGNRFEGGLGNDTLEGHAGGDTLDGGDGNDTASYEHATEAVSVNLGTGVHTAGKPPAISLSASRTCAAARSATR